MTDVEAASCKLCGANLALVGSRHRCVPLTVAAAPDVANTRGMANSDVAMRDLMQRRRAKGADTRKEQSR